MLLVHLAACVLGPAPLTFSELTADAAPYPGEVRESGAPLALVDDGRAVCDIALEPEAPTVVVTAVEGLQRTLAADAGPSLLTVGLGDAAPARPCIVPLIGEASPLLPRLRAAGLATPTDLGAQGFSLARVELDGVPVVAIWSPAAIGCRYGIIELSRSLEIAEGGALTRLTRVVSRPRFPYRCYYLNFAEHLQNRYNVNFVLDTPQNEWTTEQWHRFIEMLAAMRYNVFQFWLVPTLFDPAALERSERTERFAETMCEVIRYAHERGLLVEMLQAVNTVGPEWRYYCPNVPEEREMILRLWEFWSQRLEGVDILGLFPGDPGGCTRNGCDYRTYIDLCAEIAERTGKHRPFIYEVNSWGTPFWGWGVNAWEGGPGRAREAFDYLLERLPSFPEETYVGICMGLNPDALGEENGGSGEPYVREVSQLRPVTTWDYAASEGESTVIPRFRVARVLDRRQRESRLPYVGGINYTMSPMLNQVQAFAAAECYWSPERTVEGLVSEYCRLAFGDAHAHLGMEVFPFTEVVGDWGGGGWNGDLEALAEGLRKARAALAEATIAPEGRLALFPSTGWVRDELAWHVSLLERLARAGSLVRRVAALTGRETLSEVEAIPDGERPPELAPLLAQLAAADLPALRQEYWSRVYGIYDRGNRPVDPRAEVATEILFGPFGYRFVEPRREEGRPAVLLHNAPSRLSDLLAGRGEPYVLLDLGNDAAEVGWELRGWPALGVLEDEGWRASLDAPGTARRAGVANEGYAWLVVRLTDDVVGGRKTFSINGTEVGAITRPGERVGWLTRQLPLPADLAWPEVLELQVSEFGVGISDLALVRSPLTDEEIASLDRR